MSRQNLDRYSAVEPRVAGAVDLAHPARSERSNDFVRPEFGARCEDHRCAIIGLLDPSLPVIRRNQACYIALTQTGLFPQKRCYLLIRPSRYGTTMLEQVNR